MRQTYIVTWWLQYPGWSDASKENPAVGKFQAKSREDAVNQTRRFVRSMGYTAGGSGRIEVRARLADAIEEVK